MKRFVLIAGIIVTAFVLMLPTAAEAARHDRDGYNGERQHHKNQRHYKSHEKSRRHNRRYNSRSYFSYYPEHIRYQDWPIDFRVDLRRRHYRDREVVVLERETITASMVNAQGPTGELYIYPREGQSEAKRDEDRYECHLWSRDQTHYDPSRSNTTHALAPNYNRAMAACLEGRGYTVK
ncbi:MAG: hypothetical protein ACI9P7_000914 [Candidatus Azotimanducaceae bacterium]|jgi:hypothetical protein